MLLVISLSFSKVDRPRRQADALGVESVVAGFATSIYNIQKQLLKYIYDHICKQ